jgi:hypothetical protein
MNNKQKKLWIQKPKKNLPHHFIFLSHLGKFPDVDPSKAGLFRQPEGQGIYMKISLTSPPPPVERNVSSSSFLGKI